MSLPYLIWEPSPNFSARSARVDLLVLHDTESPTAAGAVEWFKQKRSEVSAHYVLDESGLKAWQMVHLADKAWHVESFNSRSVGLEMGGYAKKGYPQVQLLAAAEMIAWMAYHLQIPVRHARGGVGPGIETHHGLGAAGGGHTDPWTDQARTDNFIAKVQAAANRHDFPLLWEAPGPNASMACMARPSSVTLPRLGDFISKTPFPTLE